MQLRLAHVFQSFVYCTWKQFKENFLPLCHICTLTRFCSRKKEQRPNSLGLNWDKSLKSFPPCWSQSPRLTDFTPHPPPPRKSGLKKHCIRNLKSENSQEYAQKPQWNCTFMNLASGFKYLVCPLSKKWTTSKRRIFRTCLTKLIAVGNCVHVLWWVLRIWITSLRKLQYVLLCTNLAVSVLW